MQSPPLPTLHELLEDFLGNGKWTRYISRDRVNKLMAKRYTSEGNFQGKKSRKKLGVASKFKKTQSKKQRSNFTHGIKIQMIFSTPQPESSSNSWKEELDFFVRENKQELAALAWGLYQQQQEAGNENTDTLGIDLEPSPHFICCSRESVATLNRKVGDRLREVLGIIDNHQPDKEVLILGVGAGQIQLVQYESDPFPPDCFQKVGETVEDLLDRLEARMVEQINIRTV